MLSNVQTELGPDHLQLDVRARAALSYLFLKSLKSGSASFCIANFFLLSKKIETLSIILKNGYYASVSSS